jgi:hypothetical protein
MVRGKVTKKEQFVGQLKDIPSNFYKMNDGYARVTLKGSDEYDLHEIADYVPNDLDIHTIESSMLLIDVNLFTPLRVYLLRVSEHQE